MAKIIVKDSNGNLYNPCAIRGKTTGKSAYIQAVEAGFLGSEEEFTKILAQDSSWPIGSIYMTTSNEHPAETFGGDWKQIEDRFIYASGKYKVDAIGGEASHKLAIEEIPSHTHYYGYCYSSSSNNNNVTSIERTARTQDTSIDTYPTGGNLPHNNMPPYVAVYIY
jgi:hypothetical protein